MEAVKLFFAGVWANGFWGVDGAMLRLTVNTLARLLGAALLGGVVGFERQHSHRPAGMRTHVLVAGGAALVMCTSEYIQLHFNGGVVNADLARMGAQVISGIGFLGAGTILREGFSVRGLTTAASLWAVACVGLAAGIGFWPGALIGTGVIYLTLNYVKKITVRHSSVRTIYIGVSDQYHVSEKVTEIFRVCGAVLRRLEIIFPEDTDGPMHSKDVTKVLRAMAYIKNDTDLAMIKEAILGLEGVFDFYTE